MICKTLNTFQIHFSCCQSITKVQVNEAIINQQKTLHQSSRTNPKGSFIFWFFNIIKFSTRSYNTFYTPNDLNFPQPSMTKPLNLESHFKGAVWQRNSRECQKDLPLFFFFFV
jgi:hypothetical protein